MLHSIQLENIIFIDIETVPIQPDFEKLDAEMQKLWSYRINRFKPENVDEKEYYFEKSGVYAEFGKVICIGAGFFAKNEAGTYDFRCKSFHRKDEPALLRQFYDTLELRLNSPHRFYLCGHNLVEFDVPFLCRRSLINGLPLPPMFDVGGMKPWEVPFLDTMRLWRFGDIRNYTSLHLLCKVLGIPSPKNDMEGRDVARVFWQEDDLERIARYCKMDVLAVARIVQHLKGLPLVGDKAVHFVD